MSGRLTPVSGLVAVAVVAVVRAAVGARLAGAAGGAAVRDGIGIDASAKSAELRCNRVADLVGARALIVPAAERDTGAGRATNEPALAVRTVGQVTLTTELRFVRGRAPCVRIVAAPTG